MKQRTILLLLALAFVLMAQAQRRRQQVQSQRVQPQQQVQPQQVTPPATSGSRQDALELYRKAKMYAKGKGVEKNLTLAFELYQKAAEMGLDSAQNNLGACYADALGTFEDKEKAFYWYQKAAEQGHALAQANLAACYTQGNGVAVDEKKALEWSQKSAAQGNAKGMMKLAVIYYEGNAVPQDYQKAKELVEQVLEKEKDHKGAKIYLQRINKNLKEQQQLTATETSVEEYVLRTFGVPEKQINYIENAGLNKIRTAVRWLAKAMEVTNGKGKAIFYYAGHGIPDEASKTAYLLPVDGMAYPLSKLYQELEAIPSERITVFLDACFNGGKREGDMLASARGVAIKAKSTVPQGKIVIFTAAQGDETAYSFKSQQHGMFTYFLLKKLQDSKGNVTLGDLADYLTSEVKRQSFDEHHKLQTPTAIPSQAFAGSWRSMKLK